MAGERYKGPASEAGNIRTVSLDELDDQGDGEVPAVAVRSGGRSGPGGRGSVVGISLKMPGVNGDNVETLPDARAMHNMQERAAAIAKRAAAAARTTPTRQAAPTVEQEEWEKAAPVQVAPIVSHTGLLGLLQSLPPCAGVAISGNVDRAGVDFIMALGTLQAQGLVHEHNGLWKLRR